MSMKKLAFFPIVVLILSCLNGCAIQQQIQETNNRLANIEALTQKMAESTEKMAKALP